MFLAGLTVYYFLDYWEAKGKCLCDCDVCINDNIFSEYEYIEKIKEFPSSTNFQGGCFGRNCYREQVHLHPSVALFFNNGGFDVQPRWIVGLVLYTIRLVTKFCLKYTQTSWVPGL